MPPCKQLLTALGFFPKSKEQNNAVAVGRAPRASSCEEGSAAWTLPWPGDLFEQSKHKETALCEQWCLEHGQHQASGTLLTGFGSSVGQLYGEFQDRNAVCVHNSCSVVVLAVRRCVHCGVGRYPGHLAAGSAPKPVINTCGNCCLCHAPPCPAVFGMRAREVTHQVAKLSGRNWEMSFCLDHFSLRSTTECLGAGGGRAAPGCWGSRAGSSWGCWKPARGPGGLLGSALHRCLHQCAGVWGNLPAKATALRHSRGAALTVGFEALARGGHPKYDVKATSGCHPASYWLYRK